MRPGHYDSGASLCKDMMSQTWLPLSYDLVGAEDSLIYYKGEGILGLGVKGRRGAGNRGKPE